MRKKIYLVRNNPGCGREKREWIHMKGKDFFQFIHSPEGKGRYFVHLTYDIGYEADEIYIEADYREYCSWKKEYNHHQYLLKCAEEILTISSDAPIGNGESLLIDMITDDKISIEEEYEEQDEREQLRKIVDNLDLEERKLLNVMYLSGKPRTEQEAAEELGVSRDIIKRRKKKLFSKIQKLLRPES